MLNLMWLSTCKNQIIHQKYKMKRKIKEIIINTLHKLYGEVATKSDLDNLYNQLVGFINIQNGMIGRQVLKPMRGWAISPDAMSLIISELDMMNAPTVIEFGSGQSTVIFAAIVKNRGGSVISVEHDADYYSIINKQIQASGLSDVVKPLHVPLKDFDLFRSYDTSCITDIGVPDIALVDGPPCFHGSMTRFNPLKWCVEKMKSGGIIYLDDSFREGERQCLEKLQHEYPGLFKIEELPSEKGLTKIIIK